MVNGTKNLFIIAGKSERFVYKQHVQIVPSRSYDYFADKPMVTLSIQTSGGFSPPFHEH